MDDKNPKFKTIVICKDKRGLDGKSLNKCRKKLIVSVEIPTVETLNTLMVLNGYLSSLYNIILININFSKVLPISSTNFPNSTFTNVGEKSYLSLNDFGTIEIFPSIVDLDKKSFNCFVYSRLNTLSILLIDSNSPNFININKNSINFINFIPNNKILNMPCYVTTVPINLSDFKYISQPISADSPWEFYGKTITDTAVIVVNDNLNGKIFGSREALTSFNKDLYILSTSLIPSSPTINLEFVNIKVNGSLFIILPDNYNISLTYSNLNIIKQL